MSIFYVQHERTVVMVNAEDEADAILKAIDVAGFEEGSIMEVTALDDWSGVSHRDDRLIIGFAS